jgi:hemerythrin
MAFIDWSSQLSVNIRSIDEQHKKLVGMVNDLFEAMKTGKGKDVLGKVLDGMVKYVGTHFQTEENLMRTHGYPEYAEHKKEHDDLTKKVLELQNQYQSGMVTLSLTTGNFLKDWLTRHIMGTDKKYSAYLNAKGVS